MKKSTVQRLLIIGLTIFSISAFACPYKSFDECLVEIGKNLPPDFKPFIEKQCQALGCKNLTQNTIKNGIVCKNTKKKGPIGPINHSKVISN